MRKIKTRSAKVSIIGLGYVGLPLVIEFCKAGFEVFGFDIDEEKDKNIKAREKLIKHINRSVNLKNPTRTERKGSSSFRD